ncbi:Holliday junction branch migration protein RuvA [Williamwhitmania taraxaci]|uniref:Holliday junction branch migration complex subunit RuvA n=1 Tax=Williamwhitmania taraxaci TaxID=1640674 RepID=A0A1G6R1G2_9BACT|nr:Holliday junction branch migration protein RuvA [Williamwhitmania taraxaci]SDC98253.1 Holliday junction DNA helicase subunit RuvA [Williamwhitmania taraxaci]
MYDYIKGEVVELTPTYAVIETGGVGYLINVSLSTFSRVGSTKNIVLYTHMAIREDAHTLYGFFDRAERELFRHLIGVSGVGANTARMMLSSLSPEELRQAILLEDVNKIKSVKGIGLKTAQRVVIDLKDKLGKEPLSGELFGLLNNTIREEALSALVMLGFAKVSAQKVVDTVLKGKNDASVEELIKLSLKQL